MDWCGVVLGLLFEKWEWGSSVLSRWQPGLSKRWMGGSLFLGFLLDWICGSAIFLGEMKEEMAGDVFDE